MSVLVTAAVAGCIGFYENWRLEDLYTGVVELAKIGASKAAGI